MRQELILKRQLSRPLGKPFLSTAFHHLSPGGSSPPLDNKARSLHAVQPPFLAATFMILAENQLRICVGVDGESLLKRSIHAVARRQLASTRPASWPGECETARISFSIVPDDDEGSPLQSRKIRLPRLPKQIVHHDQRHLWLMAWLTAILPSASR